MVCAHEFDAALDKRKSQITQTARSILEYYDNSLLKSLKQVYPDHVWHEWHFGKVPSSYWERKENRTAFMNWLAEEKKISELADWYTITRQDLISRNGGGLLRHYFDDSASTAVMLSFPSHPWLPWKFQRAPKGYWNILENRKKFLAWYAEQNKIKEPDNWYQVQTDDISKAGGAPLLGSTSLQR
jgi:hypothetical protein